MTRALLRSQQQTIDLFANEDLIIREFTVLPEKADECGIRLRFNEVLAKILINEPPTAIIPFWQPATGKIVTPNASVSVSGDSARERRLQLSKRSLNA